MVLHGRQRRQRLHGSVAHRRSLLEANGRCPGGAADVIYGASGSLGTAAVQLARDIGAHVTAVCNTRNVELVRSLGADEVVDYLQEDFTKIGQTCDAIIDAVRKYSFIRDDAR